MRRLYCGVLLIGGVAQLGEHLLCKQGVVGSSPITSTRRTFIACLQLRATQTKSDKTRVAIMSFSTRRVMAGEALDIVNRNANRTPLSGAEIPVGRNVSLVFDDLTVL